MNFIQFALKKPNIWYFSKWKLEKAAIGTKFYKFLPEIPPENALS